MTMRIFAVEKDGTRREITDLYWFEENSVHSFDEIADDGSRVEAIADVPRCDQCRFWERYPLPRRDGECRRITDDTPDGDLARLDASASLDTRADFGCRLSVTMEGNQRWARVNP